ncbi:unnamed protein product [Rotaria socialis]|uniref:Inner centromere protein ARK-binding domain-containing protein n=3 Tax=Rotaria socialis TaxID=392032 RepID=A0A821BH45_9BILA|nr:unnamed protein product [Rotaria socialis]CAF4268204.1 unnamed protein product [Rotaria socialis]CAF4517353.1 unnamed protein product [Rotaria socialis]CAF4594928.1 unnamed protein product [Rotaria socialis]
MLTQGLIAMKLRSHEILSNPILNSKSIPTKPSSRFKKLFQGKSFFKKKPQSSSTRTHESGLLHGIPDYVRKSILRYLLESPPPPPSSSSPLIIQQNSPSRNVRPPLMGIQALKNKKQHTRHQTKRPLRTRPQTVPDNRKSLEDYQAQNNYDMTILNANVDDDNDDNSMFATKTSTHQKKPIPQWARKHELQIAMCNQIYFHRNPSEIFGNTIDCSPANLRTILHSMLPNVQLIDDDHQQQSISIPINSNKSILV